MKGRRSILKKASAIASGKGMGMVFATIRNMTVATLIGPDHYGVAFIFAITISLLEVMGVLAWDVLLIQAEDGNDPRLQQTAHTMMLLRGFIISAVMIGSALFFYRWGVNTILDMLEVAPALDKMAEDHFHWNWAANLPVISAALMAASVPFAFRWGRKKDEKEKKGTDEGTVEAVNKGDEGEEDGQMDGDGETDAKGEKLAEEGV